jgi:hypothetical protein
VKTAYPRVLLILFLACPTFEVATGQTPPLPRAKPAGAGSSMPAPHAGAMSSAVAAPPMEVFAADPEPMPVPMPPSEPSACQRRIGSDIAVIAAQPPLIGPGDCGAVDVVKLEAIILKDKSRVAVTPAATLRCPMAEALAQWLREDVVPAVAALGGAVQSLDNYASFNCRGRNRVAGAIISEHGLANAIDIRGLGLVNGTFAGLTDRGFSKEFREAMKKSACARFATVLGPGSDGHHESHVHLDLAERRGGYRLCQWDVLEPIPEVPLPRARPAEAPQAQAAR